MKKLTVIALGSLFVAPVAAEEIDRTLDAAADGSVNISNISGSVTVEGWDRNEVRVTGELGRNVEELIFERDGDTVMIKVKVPRKGGRGIESDLHVSVPEGSSIDVGTVSADIEVSRVFGEQKLNAVSGDIDAATDSADVSVGTVSGDVEIKGGGKDAETRGTTVSGDVVFENVAGEVTGESVSGDVTIAGGAFDRVALSAVNGDIAFGAQLRAGGKLTGETVNGEIELQFEGGVSGRFDVDTFNGDINNCFGPKPERTSKYTPGKKLDFQEGDGDTRISVSTMNGDITICQ
jgi:DUF4097 and DUF4098 domain-containing protein YvlB